MAKKEQRTDPMKTRKPNEIVVETKIKDYSIGSEKLVFDGFSLTTEQVKEIARICKEGEVVRVRIEPIQEIFDECKE